MPDFPSDDEVMSLLGESFDDDGTPPLLVAAALAAFGWSRADSELAEMASGGMLATRSETNEIEVFAVNGNELELTLHSGRITGRVDPPNLAVELQCGERSEPVEISSFGSFEIAAPTGPWRLRCGGPTGFHTPWQMG